MRIATVYKQGGDYGPEYVDRLQSAVARHTTADYEFLVLTDDPGLKETNTFVVAADGPGDSATARTVIPLHHAFPGWWSKMEVFTLAPPILYFDLDTVIVGSLEPMIAAVEGLNGTVAMLRDFYTGRWASGVMGFTRDLHHLFQGFVHVAERGRFRGPQGIYQLETEERVFHGDQNYLEEAFLRTSQPLVALQDLVRGIYSYKVDIRQKRGLALDDDACVVCFHGRPRPHDLARAGGPAWFRENW